MGIRWGENPREQHVPTAAAEQEQPSARAGIPANSRWMRWESWTRVAVDAWLLGESWSRGAVDAGRPRGAVDAGRLGTWGVIERMSQEQRASSAAAEQPSRGRTGGWRSRDAACRGPRSTEEGTVTLARSGCGRAAEAEMRIPREQPPARHPRQSAKKKLGLAT
jgi:hypothetical protein